MTVGATQVRVGEAADDSTRILSLTWEKTEPFGPLPGAAVEADWILLSWGPSRSADALSTALRAADPQAGVRRADVSIDPAEAAEPTGREQRHVLFVDETVPLAGPGLSGDESWAWAHAVVHAFQRAASRPSTRLWIVTRTGLNSPRTREVVRPEHDFAWALGRSHAAENPESWGGLVDLDLDDPLTAGRMLADYLLSDSAEDEVLLREDGPRVARVASSALPPTASGAILSAERLHVVSGGATGLSFEVEHWLARRGAKRLLILGRSPVDDIRTSNLRLLESLGCDVVYETLDVADPTAVRALTARLRSQAIGGVFHLASNWRLDGQSCVSSLVNATDEQNRVLLGAKAGGALLLGELAEQLNAEAAVFFSSATATFGSPGQANYAAANAVLDGVARRLHGSPVRAVSIAWGPVGDVGFGATAQGSQLHDAWERLGLRRLGVQQVLSTMEMALSQDEPNLTVVAWDEDAGLLPWAGTRPTLQSLVAEQPTGNSLARLNELPDEERAGLIVEVIRTRIAQIMGGAPEDVDPDLSFALLGIDSLIALEVLFIVEREFGVRLGLDHVVLGMNSNLTTMARQLDERIRELAPGAGR
jgi:acyl carrier protein/NADP-dependent 3-hydroxy acid dehydrogenase YdfG